MKRNVNNISEVELNLMGACCIGKSIERLLCFGFEIFYNTDDLVNRRLVDQTTWSIDEQANVLVELNFRWKFHCSFGFSFRFVLLHVLADHLIQWPLPLHVPPRETSPDRS